MSQNRESRSTPLKVLFERKCGMFSGHMLQESHPLMFKPGLPTCLISRSQFQACTRKYQTAWKCKAVPFRTDLLNFLIMCYCVLKTTQVLHWVWNINPRILLFETVTCQSLLSLTAVVVCSGGEHQSVSKWLKWPLAELCQCRWTSWRMPQPTHCLQCFLSWPRHIQSLSCTLDSYHES